MSEDLKPIKPRYSRVTHEQFRKFTDSFPLITCLGVNPKIRTRYNQRVKTMIYPVDEVIGTRMIPGPWPIAIVLKRGRINARQQYFIAS